MNTDISAEYLLEQAENYKSKGEYLHSIQLYVSLINTHPRFPAAYFNLAEIYDTSGFYVQAVEVLKSYSKLCPDENEAKLYTANLMMRNERWDDALVFLSRFVSKSEPVYEFFRGYCNFMLGNFRQAENHFNNYIGFEGKSDYLYEALLCLSKCEIELNELDLALNHLTLSGAYYEDFWEWNLLIAKVYAMLNMENHALKHINRAVKKNRKNTEVLTWAARICNMNGKISEAEKFYLSVINSAKIDSAEFYNEYADFCAKNSKLQEAINHYKLALKLEPDNIKAKAALYQLHSVSDNNREK